MASNYTENYGLCQWEATDQVLRKEFNEDNAKIDGALQTLAATMLHFVHGTYTGTGEATQIHYSVGARPKALIVTSHNYHTSLKPTARFLFATDSLDIRITSDGQVNTTFNDLAEFDEDGFILDHSHDNNVELGLNRKGYQMDYWVLY